MHKCKYTQKIILNSTWGKILVRIFINHLHNIQHFLSLLRWSELLYFLFILNCIKKDKALHLASFKVEVDYLEDGLF